MHNILSTYGEPRNYYIILRHQVNKHNQTYHRAGRVISSDARSHRIKPGMTIYYYGGHVIAKKHGVEYIAITQHDIVFIGAPKD